MTVQLSALCAAFRATEPGFETRCAQLAQDGGVLGLFVRAGPVDDTVLCRALDAAGRHGLAVDLHIDEHLESGPLALQALADAVIATGFDGPVLAGHGCALSVAPDGPRQRCIEAIARAGIAIAALPRTNLYLQDRAAGQTPTRRGVTLIRELDAQGIPVALASDNVEDAFYPFGDYDLLRLLADTAVTAHLDQALVHWLRAVSHIPAVAMGLTGWGALAAGDRADFLLVPSRSWPGLLLSPPGQRVVVKDGARLQVPAPDTNEEEELADV